MLLSLSKEGRGVAGGVTVIDPFIGIKVGMLTTIVIYVLLTP